MVPGVVAEGPPLAELVALGIQGGQFLVGGGIFYALGRLVTAIRSLESRVAKLEGGNNR